MERESGLDRLTLRNRVILKYNSMIKSGILIKSL